MGVLITRGRMLRRGIFLHILRAPRQLDGDLTAVRVSLLRRPRRSVRIGRRGRLASVRKARLALTDVGR